MYRVSSNKAAQLLFQITNILADRELSATWYKDCSKSGHLTVRLRICGWLRTFYFLTAVPVLQYFT
jgi:hypothetical protein